MVAPHTCQSLAKLRREPLQGNTRGKSWTISGDAARLKNIDQLDRSFYLSVGVVQSVAWKAGRDLARSSWRNRNRRHRWWHKRNRTVSCRIKHVIRRRILTGAIAQEKSQDYLELSFQRSPFRTGGCPPARRWRQACRQPAASSFCRSTCSGAALEGRHLCTVKAGTSCRTCCASSHCAVNGGKVAAEICSAACT